MDTALVSIIIPIYKISEYLDKCVASASNQTYRNLEIILVDDGSPDDCPAKCDAWVEKDSRIRVIHKLNGGLSDARNAGLDAATGEFIYFLDGDDYVEANLIEKALSHMADDVDMVYFGYLCHQAEEKVEKRIPKVGTFELLDEQKKRTYILDILDWSGWEAWKRLLRKSVIDQFNLRFEDNKRIFAEDLHFCLCYSAHARKCIGITDCLYHYIIRSNSIMGVDSTKLNVGRMNELSKAVRKHYEQHEDCKFLLEIFPLIHYLIISNPIKAVLNRGIHIRQLRDMVFQDVSDKYYFVTQLRAAYCLRKIFYQYLGSWNATNSLNTCKYLINGSYTELRIRNRLLYRFPQLFERKGAKIKGIEAECQEFAKNQKKIYLIGTEDFGNLGDHQIAESINSFLKKHFSEYELKEITASEYKAYRQTLKKYIQSNDIIALTGGGNLGDVYMPAQTLRENVVQTWPNNLKVVFPQTIHFTDTEYGKNELENAKKVYSGENNIVLFTRELTSYQIAQAEFTCASFLVPDIVLFTNQSEEPNRSTYALFCFRSDEEKSIGPEIIEQMKEMVGNRSMEIHYTDLQLDYFIDKKNRTTEITKAFEQWKKAKILFTDRLHGMVFAAITGTPCIVFSNYNHKVRGTYEWIKYLPYIRYAESASDVERYLPELLAMENCRYDNTPLLPYFDNLAKVVKEYAAN